jgi:RNA polymerase sporulation-specific sigma factor
MHFRSQKKLNAEVSMNDTIDVDRDGNPLTYMDIVSTSEDLGEDLDRKNQNERALRMVKNVLDERERQIITMRYGLFGLRESYTQKEIAQKLNISRSYVSRLEKSALEKLKSALS